MNAERGRIISSSGSSALHVPKGGFRGSKVVDAHHELDLWNLRHSNPKAVPKVLRSRRDRDEELQRQIRRYTRVLSRTRSKSRRNRQETCEHCSHHSCNCPQCPVKITKSAENRSRSSKRKSSKPRRNNRPSVAESSSSSSIAVKCDEVREYLDELSFQKHVGKEEIVEQKLLRSQGGKNENNCEMEKREDSPKRSGKKPEREKQVINQEKNQDSLLSKISKQSRIANALISFPAAANAFVKATQQRTAPIQPASSSTMEGIDGLKTAVILHKLNGDRRGLEQKAEAEVIAKLQGISLEHHSLPRVRTGRESNQQQHNSTRKQNNNNPTSGLPQQQARPSTSASRRQQGSATTQQQKVLKYKSIPTNFHTTHQNPKSVDFRGHVPGYQNMNPSTLAEHKAANTVTLHQLPVAATEDFIATSAGPSSRVKAKDGAGLQPAGSHMLKPKASEMPSPFYKKRAAGPIDSRNFFPDTDEIAEEIRSYGPIGVKRDGKGHREFYIHNQEPPAETKNPLAHLATDDDTGALCYQDGGAPVGGAHAMIRQQRRRRHDKSESHTATGSRQHSGSHTGAALSNCQHELDENDGDRHSYPDEQFKEALDLPPMNPGSSSSSYSIEGAEATRFDEDNWEEDTRRHRSRDEGGAELSKDPVRFSSGGPKTATKSVGRNAETRQILADSCAAIDDVEPVPRSSTPRSTTVRFSFATDDDVKKLLRELRNEPETDNPADLARGDGSVAEMLELQEGSPGNRKLSHLLRNEHEKLRMKLRYRRLAREKMKEKQAEASTEFSSTSVELHQVTSEDIAIELGKFSAENVPENDLNENDAGEEESNDFGGSVDLESPADPLDDVRSSRAAAGTSSQSKSNVDRKTIKDCCTPRFSRIQKPKRQMSEAVQKNVERVPVQTRGFDPCGETIETPKNAFEPAEPGLEDKIPSLPLFLVDQIATRVCQTVNERLDSLEKRMNCFDPPKQTVCEKPKKQRPCKSTKEEFIPISCPLKIPKTSKKYRKICDDM